MYKDQEFQNKVNDALIKHRNIARQKLLNLCDRKRLDSIASVCGVSETPWRMNRQDLVWSITLKWDMHIADMVRESVDSLFSQADEVKKG